MGEGGNSVYVCVCDLPHATVSEWEASAGAGVSLGMRLV